jgi:hypothetical protein
MKLLGKVSVWVRSLVRGPAMPAHRKVRRPPPAGLPVEPAARDPAGTQHDLEEGRVADLLQQKLERSQSSKGDHS